MDGLAVALVAMVAALGLVGVAGLALEVPAFSDPCHTWGMGESGSASATVGPGDDCQRVSGSSENRSQAMVRLAAVQGVLVVACALGVVAAVRRSRWWAAWTGMLLAAESVLLFLGLSALFLLTAGTAAVAFVAAARWGKGAGRPHVPTANAGRLEPSHDPSQRP